jgi:predicted secreted protein
MLGPGGRMRLGRTSLAATAVALVAAGCSSSGTVKVNVAAGSARVRHGDTLVVNLGPVSPGIGDEWFVTAEPERSVLRDQGMQLSDCALAGCTGVGSWRFRATHAGTTTVTFRYCFRSDPARCRPGSRGPSQPLKLKVVVF